VTEEDETDETIRQALLEDAMVEGYDPDIDPYEDMPKFEFVVVIRCPTQEQAEQVMAERINHDEEYGFDYEIGWSRES